MPTKVVFTVVSTVLINVFAFAIALVLTRGIKGTNLFRTCLLYTSKIWMGLQPSIMAASSISMGTLFIKPVNMNTARPAPKPR